jgi:hypothetical protein
MCAYVNRLVLCQCGMQPLPPCFDAHTVDHMEAHDCSSSNKQHSAQQHSIHQGIKRTAAVESNHVYKGCLLLPCIEEESAGISDSNSSVSSSNSSSNKRDIAAAEAAREVCTFVVLLSTTLLQYICTSMLAAVCMLIHGRRYQVETL